MKRSESAELTDEEYQPGMCGWCSDESVWL